MKAFQDNRVSSFTIFHPIPLPPYNRYEPELQRISTAATTTATTTAAATAIPDDGSGCGGPTTATATTDARRQPTVVDVSIATATAADATATGKRTRRSFFRHAAARFSATATTCPTAVYAST